MVRDYIQIGILIVLGLTLWAIYKQFRLQTELSKAQLLKDRFEMYWMISSEVSDDKVRSFRDFPEAWIDLELFHKKYEKHDAKIRRYIYFSERYEYLAFAHKMRPLGIPDSPEDQWVEKWVKNLLTREEFLDVHESIRLYYPEFALYLDSLTHKCEVQKPAEN